MKQYDFVRAWKNDADFDIEGPVIVCSIEELKDFYVEGFEDGYDSAAFSAGQKNYNELFVKYLTSKGIL